ncbi:MAG TPA: ABC transporter ATP-binding protein [Nitrosopumilus sp.]|nr:ABC transporter ATP-binding protein [Nitrosopumilus sp.]
MSILSIHGVSKQFGSFTVLDGVDMELEKGKLYELIGPNGSGKTTLINVVSGLLKPDDGRITFDGNDITKKGLLKTYKTGLVRTFQLPQPFTKLTTMENFLISSSGNSGESFLLAPLKSRWSKDEKRIMEDSLEMLDMVNLLQQKDIESQNLSGGQLKLLELGRAMMSGAKMILMDEPIAGVNPTLAHDIFDKIHKICNKQKITFLIVEHRLDIALQYADHVFAMNRGKIIAEGNSDDIIKHPKVIESYLGK